jgi:hypothetical protein
MCLSARRPDVGGQDSEVSLSDLYHFDCDKMALGVDEESQSECGELESKLEVNFRGRVDI